MKMGESSAIVKREFGHFLREKRLEQDWGVYDVGRMLGTSQATVWCWEKGMSFPASIIKLKKLCLLYTDIPKTVEGLIENIGGVVRWREFTSKIDCNSLKYECFAKRSCGYIPNDKRDMIYKIAFGAYLRKERQSMGVSISSLAKALGVFTSNVSMWESGTLFPQSLVTISMLNRMYGNLFDVLFGICKKNGIHLEKKEIREVLIERDRIEGCGRWTHGKDNLWRAA